MPRAHESPSGAPRPPEQVAGPFFQSILLEHVSKLPPPGEARPPPTPRALKPPEGSLAGRAGQGLQAGWGGGSRGRHAGMWSLAHVRTRQMVLRPGTQGGEPRRSPGARSALPAPRTKPFVKGVSQMSLEGAALRRAGLGLSQAEPSGALGKSDCLLEIKSPPLAHPRFSRPGESTAGYQGAGEARDV